MGFLNNKWILGVYMNNVVSTILRIIVLLIGVLALCEVVCGQTVQEPNEPINVQFHGSFDKFVVIAEWTPRERVYRAVGGDPNLCKDFSFFVKNEKMLILNSQQAVGFLARHWDYFMRAGTAMINLNILSTYYKAEPKPPIVPPVVVVEPNIVEPNIIEPNTIQIEDPNLAEQFMVYVLPSGGRYHGEKCYYVWDTKLGIFKANVTKMNVVDAMNKGKTPCGICKPLFYEE
jgi:hypothetical protein